MDQRPIRARRASNPVSASIPAVLDSTRTAPGLQILLPGDPERAMFQARSAHGIPLEPNHWQMLVDLAQRLGVPPPGALVD